MNKHVIRDIVNACKKNGLDPIEAVVDYYIEKDSRISRAEAERIIRRAFEETVEAQWTAEEVLEREG